MHLSALFLSFFFHCRILSAQLGSERIEMAFWVTQAGDAIWHVNWWKRIERKVETNDDCPVACLAFACHFFSLRSLSPNNVEAILERERMYFYSAGCFFFIYIQICRKIECISLITCRWNFPWVPTVNCYSFVAVIGILYFFCSLEVLTSFNGSIELLCLLVSLPLVISKHLCCGNRQNRLLIIYACCIMLINLNKIGTVAFCCWKEMAKL